jgi:hypothetical protein
MPVVAAIRRHHSSPPFITIVAVELVSATQTPG